MNQKIITGLLILLPVGWISAQATDLNTTTPEKPRQDYREWYTRLHQEFFPEGKPAVKGYKQFERANMEWEYHIDEEGKMPNYGQLNYDAYLQLKNTTAPSGATWDFVGPHGPDLDNDFTTGGTGRVNCIQVWDADTWFIGASGGGLWMTDNSGIYLPGIVDQPWKNLTVNMPILAISGIAVNPNDDNEIFILTGDPFNQELPSMGIFHTTDQGENWEQASLTFSRDELEYGYKLLFNPQNFQEMYAATSDGLFHTTDGWQTHSTELSQDVYDVEFKPGDPSVVYASSEDKVFRLCCGSAQFSETDAGQNENNPRRCEIAVTAAAPEWVYAVFIDQDQSMGGLYLSTDSGDEWSGESNGDFNICASEDPEDPEDKGQGAYCVAFYVSNDIPTHLWYGCVNLWASVAGGANDSWFQLTDWDSDDDVHADWHDLVYNSYTGEFIAATDGGVYASSDLGANWSNRCHGLHITEYYHIGVDNNILFTTNVAGGAQDNGTIMSMAIEGTSEDEKIQGGDGFEVYLNGYSEYGTEVYSESQHGKLYFSGYQDGLPYSGTIYPSAVEEGIENKTNRFNTPFAVSPVDWGTVIIGYEDLYYSANSGQDWFVSWDNSDYIDTQVESEIVAIDFTGGATAGFVVHLIDGNELVSSRVYTTNFLSNTILVDNGWQQFSTGSFGIPEERNISDLSFRYDEEGSDYFFRLAICLAGYDAENKVIYIPDVLNHPDSVVNLTYDMPNIPVRCVEQHEDGFYAGTDIGVFFLGNESTSWVYYNSGLPVVPVNEIEIKETMLEGEMLYIATYGRGIWRNFLADKQPVRRYVDADASGNNDGTSWENAFTDLNSALSVANPADSLWIAEGIYTPINNRDASFNINGERLYGGFDGTETQLSERDPSQHVTNLSGDIGVDGVDTDNVYRLLMLNESTNHCWFDGITFSDGYANGPSAGQKTGACIRLETMLDCEQCDPYVDKRPHFSNCRFENFYAEDYGGVLYLFDPTKVHYQGTDPVPDLPIIFENCVFLNNIAAYGGAIYSENKYDAGFNILAGDANFVVEGCTFEGNHALAGGGAIYLGSSEIELSKTLKDITFINNSSEGVGGAIYVNASIGGHANMTYDNCIFVDNHADSWGGAIYHWCSTNNSYNNPPGNADTQYTNCTFSGNTAYHGGCIADQMGGNQADEGHMTANFSGCIFLGGSSEFKGGSIYGDATNAGSTGHYTLNNCSFSATSSGTEGGAININGGGSGYGVLTLNNCTFSNCTAGSNGGALYGEGFAGGHFELMADSCEFNECLGYSGGALYFRTSSGSGFVSSVVSGTSFIDCSANGATNAATGGAIRHIGSGEHSASYSDCHFTGNQSNFRGGAISMESNNLTFENCTFEENHANVGGTVFIYHWSNPTPASASFDSCGFLNNYAGSTGGAIHLAISNSPTLDLDISSCSFEGNHASEGGSVYSSGGMLDLMVHQSDFSNNFTSTGGEGGAISCWSGGTFGITSSTFNGNSADNSGGALIFLNSGGSGTCSISQSIFTGNTADNGGAIHFKNTNSTNMTVEIDSCDFHDNTGNLGVGAVYVEALDLSNINIDNSTFTSNQSFSGSSSTGALYLKSYSATDTSLAYINNCLFQDNSAVGSAGAFYAISDGCLRTFITRCDFINNSSNNSGGAIKAYTYSNDYNDLHLNDCLFSNNNSVQKGGAIQFETATLGAESHGTINQCLFINNSTGSGGGINCLSSQSSAINHLNANNCSFSQNHATAKCGGIMFERTNGTMSGTLTNNIIWGNTDADTEVDQKQLFRSGTVTTDVSYNCVQDGVPALFTDSGGNISADPLFTDLNDAAGMDNVYRTQDDGFVPASGSPCIDTALQTASTAFDFAGTPRPQLDGYDMGAYESSATSVLCVGDLNGDNAINTTDLLIFMAAFGCNSGCGAADMNGDGSVNTSDLLIFMAAFGTSC